MSASPTEQSVHSSQPTWPRVPELSSSWQDPENGDPVETPARHLLPLYFMWLTGGFDPTIATHADLAAAKAYVIAGQPGFSSVADRVTIAALCAAYFWHLDARIADLVHGENLQLALEKEHPGRHWHRDSTDGAWYVRRVRLMRADAIRAYARSLRLRSVFVPRCPARPRRSAPARHRVARRRRVRSSSSARAPGSPSEPDPPGGLRLGPGTRAQSSRVAGCRWAASAYPWLSCKAAV